MVEVEQQPPQQQMMEDPMQHQDDSQYDQQQQPGQEGMDGQDEDGFDELVKADVINLYKQKCEAAGMNPHDAFIAYLEETYDENESIDIVIHGNDKYMFTDRITDDHLILICSTLQRYAIHIDEIDLRYNLITDIGARALGDLISKSVRLLNLNLMGN